MSFGIQESTQFKIEELVIVTKSNDRIDISAIFEELNIFDSIFMPIMNGNVLIRDSIGLSDKLLFDGSEALLINIVKDENSDVANFKKAFRIYKQTNRENQNMNSEMYIIHFVADELMYSDQQRVNQSYEMTYTEMVERILEDYLKVPRTESEGIYNLSNGIRKVIIPNLRPLEAVEWCMKRAVDFKNAPSFLFYQNVIGYNFASLSYLLKLPEVLDVKFDPKNNSSIKPIEEMSAARNLEIVSQVDRTKNARDGVDAGKFIGFDPITRTIETKKVSYMDHWTLIDHSNPEPHVSVIPNRENLKNVEMFDSKKTLSIFGAARKLSQYIKKYDPTSIPKEEVQENFVFHRKSIMKNLMQRRLKVTMPGNFQLSSGFNVNVIAPIFAKKEPGDENLDITTSAKCLIVASRHIIGFEKHETIIEVATTSTVHFVPTGIIQQTEEILKY